MPRLLALVFLLLPALAAAQETPPPPEHDPRVALRRALAVPGGGQLYNRQYVKAGVFYAGLAGIAGLAIHHERQYRHFQRVYRYAECVRFSDTPALCHPEYAAEAARYETLIQNGRERVLRAAREKSRRNRDLSLLGGGLWYGLSILDAYVNAHLIDFDTDETLSLRLSPHPEGATLRLILSLP